MITDSSKIEINEGFRLDEVLQRLRHAAQQADERFQASWRQRHEALLAELCEIHDLCVREIGQLNQVGIDQTGPNRTVENSLQQLLERLGSSEGQGPESSLDSVLNGWREEFAKLVEEVPTFLTVAVSKDYWKMEPIESDKFRLWGRLKRRQGWFSQIRAKIFTQVRKTLQRRPVRSGVLQRNVALQWFLQCYYKLPVANYLLEQWQHMQKQTALHLQKMHQTSEELFDELLSMQVDAAPSEATRADVHSTPPEIEVRLPTLAAYVGDLDKFEGESKDRFHAFLSSLDRTLQTNWQLAGTSRLPNRKFSEARIASSWEEQADELERARTLWLGLLRGEREDWTKDLQLAHLRVHAAQISEETIIALEAKINDHILPALEEPIAMIAESLHGFQSQGEQEEARLKGQILAESRSMLRTLRRETLPQAVDALVAAQVIKGLENYLARTRHAIDKLPDDYTILQRQDLSELQPKIKMVDVAVKHLIMVEIYPLLETEHEKLREEVQEQLNQIVRDISEIDQIVEFNLEAALELLEQDEKTDLPQDAHDVVIEGLQRARDQLQSLIEQNRAISEKCRDSLLRITHDFNGQIQALGSNEKILDLKYRVAKAKTKQELLEHRKRLLTAVKTSLPRFLNFLATSFKRIQSNYLRLQRLTGLAPVSTDIAEKLTHFVTHTQKQIDSLPYVYQRLFRTEPLSDERFFDGREEDLESLKREFEAWQAGQYGVTALVGEKGSGKTTLVNFAQEQIFDKLPIVKIELAGFTICTEENLLHHLASALGVDGGLSFDAFEDELREWEGKRVIVVEDIQNLFLRTVGGFDALERFLLLVTRTHEEIYWLLTCTLYSWRYLDKVINLSKFFQRVVFLDRLNKQEIESIVLKRHRVSGYKLLFEEPAEIVKTKKFRKLTDEAARQDFLKDLFFEQLNDLAAGNISVTMMFWQSAIRRIEKDGLVIDPKLDLDYSFLHQLPADELFTLAAVLQHETFSTEEHAQIFRQEARQSLLLLKRMTQRGLLFEKSSGNYVINFLLYRPVVETLTMKNVLH